MNCILFLCQGRKNNWYNELFMIISLSTPRLEATCWQLLLSGLQQINWRTEIFIYSFFFNIPYDLPGSLQCLEPCNCSCSTSPPAWMFAGDLTVIRLGRLISNLIIPLINVWCLGALAGVTITSVRPPETVKQTPAKPESRSQAKTLPVSSGLWTGKQPPLHWDLLLVIQGPGATLRKINLHDKAQFYDKKWFLAVLFSLIMKIKQTCHIERKFLLWLRKNNNIVVGFLDHLALFITEFPVTFDIVICGLWSLEMVKLISKQKHH